MIIRLATPDDLGRIVEIYNHEVVHSTATFDTEPSTVEGRQRWFEKHCPHRHPILVAEESAAILGWASLSPWSQRGAYARTAELSVYVASEHRRLGVGTALMTNLLERGKENGLGVVLARISCGEGPASRRLHESLGFSLIGTMHRVGEKFGRVLDIDLLEYSVE